MSYYKNIFKDLPFSCILFEKINEEFFIKDANTYYCKLTNTTAENLKGKIISEVFPENPNSPNLNRVLESLKYAYNNKKPHKIKALRYDLYDNQNDLYKTRYWETENIPIFDDVNNTYYILNIVKDVTALILEKQNSTTLLEELNINGNKHNQFFERITDGLYSLDLDGNFTSFNRGLIEITETPGEELLKMNFLPFCAPQDQGKILKKFNKAICGKNQKFEANFISGKGRDMVLEISLVPLKENDVIKGIYGIAKDITKNKKIKEALLQSERKFKAMVQEGSDLIGILDLEGKYKFVSETSTNVLGIPPEEFIGKIAFDYIHPEDQERVVQEFSKLEIQKQIEINPFRFKNTGGEWRWVETKATNLFDDPSVDGIVTNSRDVTDHINAQKAIKESEERYRSLFMNSQDAIMVTIPDGEILAANPSACKMFQRNEKELCLVGRAGVTNPDDPSLIQALKVRRDTGTANTELTFVRKDGTQFPGEITSSIFKDADGNLRSSMIIRDITDRKNAENRLLELNKSLNKYAEELIRANKGLEQFSYILSHNLRAPVANILGLAQLLNDKDYTEEVRMNLRNEILSNSLRMDKVMKDLNQILQIKNDFSEVKQTVDLNELVNSIKYSLQDLIQKDDINIKVNFNEVNEIKSISSFIYSIFYNLIFNSIKFRKPGEKVNIKITSKKINGKIRFLFKDDGMGLDLTKKKKEIFGLYKRFHHHVEGKGMGLFMVKTQVEMLGGEITVESKINKGATFCIELP